jgi:lysophospholipase
MLSDPLLGHVDRFEDYVKDVDRVFHEIVSKFPDRFRFVLAHSMGGAIAVRYWQSLNEAEGFPLRKFQAFAVTSPMLELPRSKFLVTNAGCGQVQIGLGASQAPTQAPYKLEIDFKNPQENDTTNSESRFEMGRDIYRREASTRLGPVTNSWVCEAQNASTTILSLGSKSFATRMLMLTATQDLVVTAEAQRKFCAQTPKCQQRTYADLPVPSVGSPPRPGSFARHELLMEIDEVRNEALTSVLRFFDAFVSGRAPASLSVREILESPALTDQDQSGLREDFRELSGGGSLDEWSDYEIEIHPELARIEVFPPTESRSLQPQIYLGAVFGLAFGRGLFGRVEWDRDGHPVWSGAVSGTWGKIFSTQEVSFSRHFGRKGRFSTGLQFRNIGTHYTSDLTVHAPALGAQIEWQRSLWGGRLLPQIRLGVVKPFVSYHQKVPAAPPILNLELRLGFRPVKIKKSHFIP